MINGVYDSTDCYVIVTDADNGTILTDVHIASGVTQVLDEMGWDVEIRAPRRGEAPGTYARRSDGTLQILGFSIPVPEALDHVLNKALDAYFEG